MDFKELLLSAKESDTEAVSQLLLMYKPFLGKESIVDGIFDEELYQELCITLLKCIRMFRF
ncbi:MAG: helix-turn-helix domain-containing protein [Lachnospiraceae bacterium]|nr:helix-turn-helix domain-containing protein [Lachnospiraceae bacterium]MBD5530687.1 helix-turn-helix domain-containing protein [Lachnospiraceae bacterium]MBD5540315.1 helix-turn-helix domain-containing protein [Lachnospiraceae bacterium]MBD5541955.1 helix-turn-helix domain-containing protein [Lachnospiraceae bacterium]